jgi:hypothetical protein
MKRLFLVMLLLLANLSLAACQDKGQTAQEITLPAPQIRVEQLPSATPSLEPVSPTPEVTLGPSPVPQQVQAWPTVDEEAWLISQIDALLAKVERELNSTDTRLKP